MHWCRVEVNGETFCGRRDGDRIVRIDGSPFAEHRERAQSAGLDEVKWLPPVVPPTFYAVGFNYKRHVEHANAKIPQRPEIGYRANNALIGHGEPIVKPRDCEGRFELEAEAVAVIGAKLRNCGRDEALAGIFGWTIGNDVSAREWQHNDRTFWRAKNCDTFKPMGPWIATEMDLSSAMTEVRVNESVVAAFKTGEMIFDVVDYIVEMARYLTLWPGDVIWMGADGASGIKPGDDVAIAITGIGTLRSPVREESLPLQSFA
jgi:2-keto-4-pentenoate hydratase/2-oxohepta-3-ene-1,7-dioic acid hydratase in catechol pathway